MKRIISLALALTLIIGTLPSSLASEFTDLAGHWAEDEMLLANANGLLYGSDGKMDPDGLLTRSQLAAILARAFGAVAEADISGYTDIPSGAWYASDMSKAVAMGVIAGSGTELMPGANVTREQTFTVLARALLLADGDESGLSAFSDAGDVSEWAVAPVSAMAAKGYVSGANGKLNPKAPIKRCEFAALLAKVFNTIQSEGTLATSITGNVLVNGNGVTLDYCTIDGDLIIADGADTVNLNAISVQGRILIRGGGDCVNMGGSTTAFSGIIVNNAHAEVKLNNTSAMATSDVEICTPAYTAGNFTSIKASADVHIGRGIIQRMDAQLEGMKITTDIGGIVNYLYVNANNIEITGTGFSSVIIDPSANITGTMLNGNPLISSVVQSTAGLY